VGFYLSCILLQIMTRQKLLIKSSTPLRLEYRNPKTIRLNSKNWRIHPRRQRQAYNAFKKEIGWAGAILINEKTGNLLDGHMRVDEAVKNGESQIPCLIGNWDEQQENLILQNLDPLGALAVADKEALASLTEANKKKLTDLQNDTTRKLAQLTQDLKVLSESEESGPLIKQSTPIRKPQEEPSKQEEEEKEEEEEFEIDVTYQVPEYNKSLRVEILNSDVFFQSDDDRLVSIPLHLPSLLPDMLATPDMVPRQVFNRSKTQKHTPDTYYCISSVPWPESRQGGVLGFFTEDYRFNNCYDFASNFLEELLEEDWTAVCVPDYSLYDTHPFPMKLWNLYRSRWCGRYWQEAGIHVIPIIQGFYVTQDLNMEMEIIVGSLPRKVPVAACQMRGIGSGYKTFCNTLNEAVDVLGIESLIIYGGLDRQKVLHGYLTDKAEIIYLPSFIKSRREVFKLEKD